MAITVADNFKYGGQKPNFERDQFKTKNAMFTYSPDFLDEGHISYCVEDKTHYKWNGVEWEKLVTVGKHYGENLFFNADFSDGLNGWDTDGLGSGSVRVYESTLMGKAVALDGGSISQTISLNRGSEYTITSSNYVGGSAHNGLKVYIGNQDNVNLDGETVTLEEGYVKFPNSGTPEAHTITFTAASSEDVNVEFRTGEWSITKTEMVFVNGLSISEANPLDNKQDKLESGVNIKTINGESILGEGNIEIASGGSEFVNGGVINITEEGTIEAIYDSLEKGGVALCYIGDSNGNYPSLAGETRVNVNSKYCVESNYFFSADERGANVGDLLMITKQTYLSLLTVCALRIIPVNDAKLPTEEFAGTEGVMTVWDKKQINKISELNDFITDTRNWLSSVNDTLEKSLHRTRYGWGVDFDECVNNGVCAYSLGVINGMEKNWTLIVDCSHDPDSGGYYHFTQTAICRDVDYLGKTFKRLGWYKLNGGSVEDLNFLDWQLESNLKENLITTFADYNGDGLPDYWSLALTTDDLAGNKSHEILENGTIQLNFAEVEQRVDLVKNETYTLTVPYTLNGGNLYLYIGTKHDNLTVNGSSYQFGGDYIDITKSGENTTVVTFTANKNQVQDIKLRAVNAPDGIVIGTMDFCKSAEATTTTLKTSSLVAGTNINIDRNVAVGDDGSTADIIYLGFEIGTGLKVLDDGARKALVTTGDGSSGSITLSTGLAKDEAGAVYIPTGAGINHSESGLVLSLGSEFTFDGGQVVLSVGSGLVRGYNSLELNLGSGIGIDNNTGVAYVKTDVTTGLEYASDGSLIINIDTLKNLLGL